MNAMFSLRYTLKYVLVGDHLFKITILSYYNIKYVRWRIRKSCKKQDNHATI
jgi:hypothetical protein